jgi:uncharacterized radical SAM superfamily Fe-S cluster-containing enzyme
MTAMPDRRSQEPVLLQRTDEPSLGGARANQSFCNSCRQLVPSAHQEHDGKVFLVKDCPECGRTETLIASDARRYFDKRALDYAHEYHGCTLDCTTCPHAGSTPSFAFVDVTNRCDMNCPICCDNVPSMGFKFDPPLDYFDRLFKHLAGLEPRPAIALFGGEPTAREDLFDIIALSRSYGLKTRVVTNGQKMADQDYCDRLLATRATILLSYDGARPETYRRFRGSDRPLALKQKAIENIGRSPNLRPGRIYLITCVAKGINDDEMPELLDFYHSKRRFVSTVHFMPLAHTWESEAMGFEPERITTEDIEELVDRVYPDDSVGFIPAGFVARFSALSAVVNGGPFPFHGAHPNCESVYLLVSNGEQYVPVSRYLKCTLVELAHDMMEIEKRLTKGETAGADAPAQRSGIAGFIHKARMYAAVAPFLLRHVRFGRLLRGWGPGKLWHAAALIGRLLAGASARGALAAHTNVHSVLQLIILPFEDNHVIETERLQRCPNLHVYLDPHTGELGGVPVCAWRLFNRTVMSEIADHYAGQESETA